MNGRRAKDLRRQALAETPGLPAKQYSWRMRPDIKGKIQKVCICLVNCTRRRYLDLKART